MSETKREEMGRGWTKREKERERERGGQRESNAQVRRQK